MPVQFAVLASGSSGNSTLIRSCGAGLLLDVGLGPRALEERLAIVGSAWDHLAAAILTHTHGDHVDTHTLANLARRRIPFYCHEGHAAGLARLAGFSDVKVRGEELVANWF